VPEPGSDGRTGSVALVPPLPPPQPVNAKAISATSIDPAIAAGIGLVDILIHRPVIVFSPWSCSTVVGKSLRTAMPA
jgi:hypothetical protein